MPRIRVRFDGHAFIPEASVDLPTDAIYEFDLEAQPVRKLKLSDLARSHPSAEGTPTDLAAQHDHHLYGTSKRP